MKETTESDSNNGVTRRGYLQSTGTVGAGILGISSLSGLVVGRVGEGSGKNKKEIVITENSEGPVQTDKVSKKWYKNVEKARKKASKLKNNLLNRPGVVSIGIGTSDSTIGGLKTKSIKIGLDKNGTPANIPEHAEGIPTQVEKTLS